MKHTALLFLVLLTASTFTACDEFDFNSGKEENLSLEKDFKLVEINNEYSIRIPKYMKEAKSLNEEASLQYQNIFKEAYTIIIDESKEQLISTFQDLDEYNSDSSVVKNYRDIQLSLLGNNVDIQSKSEPKALKIHGLEAEMVEMDVKVEGINYDVTYFLTFIEGRENVYMVMAWTLKDKKDKYRNTFEKSAKSFRLI